MAQQSSTVSKAGRKNGEISTKALIYRVAGVEIDPIQASVRRGGEILALRPKTYRFLLYLAEHHNRLVSKEELIEQVWGGANVSDGVLVQSVMELRRAFGGDPKGAGIIKTFPKMGYGLMAQVECIGGDANAEAETRLEPSAPTLPARRRLARAAIAITAAVLLMAAVAVTVRSRKGSPPARFNREAAWWKLDDVRGGKVLDASGHGIQGTVTANVRVMPGKLGNGLWFDGLQTAVSGPSDALPAGNSARTITAWFKVALPFVDQGALFDYGSAFRGTTRERLTLYLQSDGRLLFGLGGSVTGAGHWADGAWHFVAASYGGGSAKTARIFVDGEVDAEQRLAIEPATERTGTWKIGGFILSGASFRGTIDDVRVFPSALSPAGLTGIYRCSAGLHDLDQYYYLPVFNGDTSIGSRGPQDLSTPFWNRGKDLAGIQLARAQNDCGLANIEGADAGQDLRIAVDLMVPLSDEGKPTLGGPYFRSRQASAGDGLIGGTSAGYWVQLESTGMVRIKRLNPWSLVAFSEPDTGFDASVYHHLEMEARGDSLKVRLDGKTLSFDQGDNRVTSVKIPPVWLGPPAVGVNQGTAGVAFGTRDLGRGLAGGQRASNLDIQRLDPR